MSQLPQDIRVKTSARSRLALLVALLLVGLTSAACIQQSNTYPIEIFKEMHYAQFHRSQEPPRVLPPEQTVAFSSSGGPEATLDVPAVRERPYDPEVAADLYRVNCAACHGINGTGDGPAARHIASPDSFYATTNGSTYRMPPDLTQTALNEDAVYAFVNNGTQVMPRFGKLLTEEEIRDIVKYVFDAENGLGAGQ